MTKQRHLCAFDAKRAPLEGGPPPKCDRVGCAKRAAGYGAFVWGASPLCQKHLDEDCPDPGGAKPTAHPDPRKHFVAREKYMLYVRGFRDGAGVHAMRANHGGLEAYERGYADGIRARQEHVHRFCEELGYEPEILRTAGGTP